MEKVYLRNLYHYNKSYGMKRQMKFGSLSTQYILFYMKPFGDLNYIKNKKTKKIYSLTHCILFTTSNSLKCETEIQNITIGWPAF